jgi:hypothetical protein
MGEGEDRGQGVEGWGNGGFTLWIANCGLNDTGRWAWRGDKGKVEEKGKVLDEVEESDCRGRKWT